MFYDQLPSRSKLIAASLVWFAFWFGIHSYSVYLVSQHLWVSIIDAGIALMFILLGISLLFFLQRYTGAFLNRPFIRIAVLAGVIAEILFFQRWAMMNYYDPESYSAIVESTWLIRIVVAFSQVIFYSVVLWLLFYIKKQDERNRKQLEAENLFREAELSRLRQQLQPHFLFNALNSINSLLITDPKSARQMVLNLSDFLRGTLKEDESKSVLFSEEIQLLKLYLEIEKVRFGHRLQIEIDVEDTAQRAKIPPLLIQPVIENAIKFGLYDVLDNVMIRISAKMIGNQLHIEVSNPCGAQMQSPPTGKGFGLSMIRRRLQLLYHRSDLLKTSKTENLFITTLQIPQL